MPEASEVQVAASQLAHAAVGRVIDALAVTHPRSSRAQPVSELTAVVGRGVTSVEPHGKWIVVALDDCPVRLGVHLRMSGQLLAAAPGAPHPDRHVHAVLAMGSRPGRPPAVRGVPGPPAGAPGADAGPVDVWFRDPRTFGELRILHGPGVPVAGDLRATTVTGAGAHSLAARRRIPVKALLLDQSTICSGIGSYLADEALHRAGIAPVTPSSSLDVAAWERVLGAARAVAAASAAAGGLTLADEGWVDLWGRPGTYGQHLRVHARPHCATCGTATERAVVSGRSARWCPRCQPSWPPAQETGSPHVTPGCGAL